MKILGAAGHSQAGHHNLAGDHIQVGHRSQVVVDSRRAAVLHMQAAGSQEAERHSQGVAAHTQAEPRSAQRNEDPLVVGLRQAVARPLEVGRKHGHGQRNLEVDTQLVVDIQLAVDSWPRLVEDDLN